ncbi:MAG: Holliday junction branch migration protein RuvA [Balneolaceae bacterium]
MIAYLKGALHSKSEGEALVETGGVGYRVEISSRTEEALPGEGEPVTLLIYHHITENDQRLFGFSDEQEKALFEQLITVKGIGPRLGLTILSGMSTPLLIDAITSRDLSSLSGISGIGKKTAERMVLELKDKIFSTGSAKSPAGSAGSVTGSAVSALEALGFKRRDAEKAVLAIRDQDPDKETGEIVKAALHHLNRS